MSRSTATRPPRSDWRPALRSPGGFGSGHSTGELAVIWDAMRSGLALRELCGGIDPARAERIWRDSLGALVAGLSPRR